jgi:hypothetical protein
VHRDHDPRADLGDRVVEIGERDRQAAAGQRQQDVDAPAQRSELLAAEPAADVGPCGTR